jgi:hypothetical protein
MTGRVFRWTALGAGLGVAGYGAWAAFAWLRCVPGRRRPDAVLDRFAADFEIEERQAVLVRATAEEVFALAVETDLEDSPVVRAIVRAREFLLGTRTDGPSLPRGLLRKAEATGWGLLEKNERILVMGAVTQPWLANVVFRPLPPDELAAFDAPGFAKIVWTIGVDSVGAGECVLRTATRVKTTSVDARRKFRNYWAFISPGVRLIRWALLWRVKRLAEHPRRVTGAARPALPD